MATGAPDWQGLRWKTEILQRNSILFPSGRIIFQDGFDSPTMSWRTGGVGTETVGIAAGNTFAGDGAAFLITDTNINDTAFIQKEFAIPPTKKLGVQFAFNFDINNDSRLEIKFEFDDGTDEYTAKIRLAAVANTIEVWNSGGAYETISSNAKLFDAVDTRYNILKLVVDFDATKYVYLLLNDDRFDLSSYSVENAAGVIVRNAMLTITAETTAGGSSTTIYVDELMVTEE